MEERATERFQAALHPLQSLPQNIECVRGDCPGSVEVVVEPELSRAGADAVKSGIASEIWCRSIMP